MQQHRRPLKVFSCSNLEIAWQDVSKGKRKSRSFGVDGQTIESFAGRKDQNLRDIRSRVLAGTYKFSLLNARPIPKPGSTKVRIIAVPTVEDRIVQRCILNFLLKGDRLKVLNPVSHGFIKDVNRGVPSAVNEAKKYRKLGLWVLKTDISSFFDRINRDLLFQKIDKKLNKTSIFHLLKAALSSEINTEDPEIQKIVQGNGIVVDEGIRQGMPLSPLISNFVLKEFDAAVQKRRLRMVRYADDLILFCKDESACKDAYRFVETELQKIRLGVPELSVSGKSVIRSPEESVEFLGFELCGKKESYAVRIPSEAYEHLNDRLNVYGQFQTAFEKKRTLSRVIQTIENIVAGYERSYNVADSANHAEFKSYARSKKKATINSLLKSMFGAQVIKNLSPKHREFLGFSSD